MTLVRRNLRRLFPSLLTFSIVVLTLEAQSIWWDEGISLHLAGLPWRDLLLDRAANIHPPLYFVLLKGWLALAGITPFSGRYLSALAITLLPAATARFLARRAGSRSGRVVALLVSVAPPFIVYGQEVRAYALLPLGVLALWSLAWPARDDRDDAQAPGSVRPFVLGAVLAALALTHYAGLVAWAAAALWVVIRALRMPTRAGRRRLLWNLAQGIGIAMALIAPWVCVVAAAGLKRLGAQAGLANPTATPVPLGYVAGMLGLFHTTAQPAALGDPALVRPSALSGLLLLLGVLVGLWRRSGRALLGASLFHWLVPFAAAPIIWALSPQSHPRYLYAFVVGGWVTTALVVACPVGRRRWLRLTALLLRCALLGAVLTTSVLGLRANAVEPRYARSDVRGVAAFLRDQATPGDVVVVPATDWSLEQYEVEPARIVMAPETGAWEWASAALARQIGAAPAVYVLDYQRDAVDPRDALRTALTASGHLVARHAFQGVALEVYAMAGALREPPLRPVERVCAPALDLCLEAVGYAEHPVSGAALPVVLRWTGAASGIRCGAALRLYDPSGALVASLSEPLIDGALAPTDLWTGDRVLTYHVVPLPVGLRPAGYRLEVGIYDTGAPDRTIALVTGGGEPLSALPLGEVVPLLQPWRDTSAYGLPGLPQAVAEELLPGVSLEAAGIDRTMASPGETLFVSTLWRLGAVSESEAAVEVVLEEDARVLDAVSLRVADPGTPAGRPLLHVVALTVPADAAGGEAGVMLRVGADRALALGRVALEDVGHIFAAPPAEHSLSARAGSIGTLVGFTLSPGAQVTSGAPLTLTLQWRAGDAASGTDLKGFVHLVVNDEIVAQHDAAPANWSRPTTGWVAGEIVIDAHALAWAPGEVTGPARLLIGLYDPVTGQRVIWEDGKDAYVLPVEIDVIPAR